MLDQGKRSRDKQINHPPFPPLLRAAAVVSRAEGDLLLHAVGTGDQDELSRECLWLLGGEREGKEREQKVAHTHHPSPSVARALRAVGATLRDTVAKGRPLTEAAALEGYGAVVTTLDAAAWEGVLDAGARAPGRGG